MLKRNRVLLTLRNLNKRLYLQPGIIWALSSSTPVTWEDHIYWCKWFFDKQYNSKCYSWV